MDEQDMINPNYVYGAKLLRIRRGDSYILDIDLGFGISRKTSVRLNGVEAPELNSEFGEASALFAQSCLVNADITVRSHKDNLTDQRWMCDIWYCKEAGRVFNLAEQMIKSGHVLDLAAPINS